MMGRIILFAAGLLLLSCKVKLASFNPSSSEHYRSDERPRKWVDTAQNRVSADSGYVSIDTAYSTVYEQAEDKIQITEKRIFLPPAQLIQKDSVLPKRITEPLGVTSGITGGLSAVGLLAGIRSRAFLFFLILGGAALILGIVSLVKIGKNRKKYKGWAGPVIGIVTSIPAVFLIVFFLAYACSASS